MIISQKFKFLLGPLHLTLAAGDLNNNGIVNINDTIARCSVAGFKKRRLIIDGHLKITNVP